MLEREEARRKGGGRERSLDCCRPVGPSMTADKGSKGERSLKGSTGQTVERELGGRPPRPHQDNSRVRTPAAVPCKSRRRGFPAGAQDWQDLGREGQVQVGSPQRAEGEGTRGTVHSSRPGGTQKSVWVSPCRSRLSIGRNRSRWLARAPGVPETPCALGSLAGLVMEYSGHDPDRVLCWPDLRQRGEGGVTVDLCGLPSRGRPTGRSTGTSWARPRCGCRAHTVVVLVDDGRTPCE